MKNNNALVIGAGGFLGNSVANKITSIHDKVFGISLLYSDDIKANDKIEYIQGSISDEKLLGELLDKVDIVYYFLSTTFPNSSSKSLIQENDTTIKFLIYTLDTMVEHNVKKIVFPSSGGAVYGNKLKKCRENDSLEPINSYGCGKMISESILRYYSNNFGIDCLILRIGNVYGMDGIRTVNQGAIDIFIQKAIVGERITIWKNALNALRDYIYIDDFTDALVACVSANFSGFIAFNVGTGIGTDLSQIIAAIEKCLNKKMIIAFDDNSNSAVKDIVLDTTKIQTIIGWFPKFNLESGIKCTIEKKLLFIKNHPRT